MKKKLKEKMTLSSIRQQIGELISEADNAGLHNLPYQLYDASQSELKNIIILKLNTLENQLIDCMRWQESAYHFLDTLLTKFTNREAVSEKDVIELILNTDRSLLNKNISFRDKISQALQLLKRKVSNEKKTLLDIYFIHKTIEVEGCRIGWQIPQYLAEQLIKIIDKYFTVNLSYATSEEYYLLKKISDEKNFDNAFNLYYNNLDLLLDLTYIKVNDGQEGTFVPVNLYKPFESVENIAENLYSPFWGGQVNFVSGTITQRIKNISMTQRHVSLDVNTVSYIRTMTDEGLDGLPSDHIKILIKNIDVIKQASSFDYLPYILENTIFSPSNEERVLATVKSVEHFLYPDNEEQCMQYYETVKSSFKEYEVIEWIKNEYYTCYVLLLSICYIHFKFNKMKPLQKLKNFCLYMDKMLFLFREPFVEVAFNFFEHKNQYRFFKKNSS